MRYSRLPSVCKKTSRPTQCQPIQHLVANNDADCLLESGKCSRLAFTSLSLSLSAGMSK